ncbi:MAG: ACP phosphodiesterase [Gammaproteobacteria bacterium]|nr:ACP phosphodiesterase [Gammaproteobacteria bacterium]
MNYLAHLLLSDPDPESLVGSLMGDFVKGRVDAALPPALRRAIILHRRIDSYTDAHAGVRRSRCRVSPAYRRYAGILVDLFYDHVLARRWSDYADVPLEVFARRVHAALRRHHADLPARMQHSMAYLVGNDLLLSYRGVAGIGRALHGIERRLKRPSGLGAAVAELQRDYAGFADDFALFFPQLQAYVDGQRAVVAGLDAIGRQAPAVQRPG